MFQAYPQGFIYPYAYQAPPPDSAQLTLPPGAKQIGDQIRYKDPKDRFYYHNIKTLKTVQDKPKEFEEEDKDDKSDKSEGEENLVKNTEDKEEVEEDEEDHDHNSSNESDTPSKPKPQKKLKRKNEQENQKLNKPTRLQSEHKDEKNRSYYYNCQTKKSQWNKPKDFDTAILKSDDKVGEEEKSKNKNKKLKISENKNENMVFNPNPTNYAQMMSAMQMQMQQFAQAQAQAQAQHQSSTGGMMIPANMLPYFAPQLLQQQQFPFLPPYADNAALKEEQQRKKQAAVEASKGEAKRRFIALLSDMEIKSDAKWSEILPAIIGDERYTAIKTLAERKKIFSEWKKEKRVEEEAEDKQRHSVAEAAFYAMLKESQDDFDLNMPIEDLERLFADDKRFKAVDDKHIRADLIRTFVKKLLREEKRKRKEERLKNMDTFDTLIRKDTSITHSSEQAPIYEKYCKQDSNLSQKLSQNDMRLVFDEYIDDLKQKDLENKAIEKQRKREEEKDQRDQFRVLLKELLKKEKFHAKSQWSEILPFIQNDQRYKTLKNSTNKALTAESVFEDYCEELERLIRDDKQILKKILTKFEIKIFPNDSIDSIQKKVQSNAKISSDPDFRSMKVFNTRLIFHEFIGKAMHKEHKKSVKREKRIEDFLKLLYKKRVNQMLEWVEVKKQLSSYEVFSLLSEEERVEVFENYMEELKRMCMESITVNIKPDSNGFVNEENEIDKNSEKTFINGDKNFSKSNENELKKKEIEIEKTDSDFEETFTNKKPQNFENIKSENLTATSISTSNNNDNNQVQNSINKDTDFSDQFSSSRSISRPKTVSELQSVTYNFGKATPNLSEERQKHDKFEEVVMEDFKKKKSRQPSRDEFGRAFREEDSKRSRSNSRNSTSSGNKSTDSADFSNDNNRRSNTRKSRRHSKGNESVSVSLSTRESYDSDRRRHSYSSSFSSQAGRVKIAGSSDRYRPRSQPSEDYSDSGSSENNGD